MLQALTRGKLSREQENLEDILTSEVFGLLRYVAVDRGLLSFLARAESLDGARPFENMTEPITVTEWCFWPTWEEQDCHACEPDLFICFKTASGKLHAICLEAKYWSGKSNSGAIDDRQMTDQLAKQWDNLKHIAERQGAVPTLIYLTTHSSKPRDELAASIAD